MSSEMSYEELLQKEIEKYVFNISSIKKIETDQAATVIERSVLQVKRVHPEIDAEKCREIIAKGQEVKGNEGVWSIGKYIIHQVIEENLFGNKNKVDIIEKTIRLVLAYFTMGMVAAPLEGLLRIEQASENYIRLVFAGPIRSAGGSDQAITVLLTDYMRQLLDIPAYIINEQEINWIKREIELYHKYVARLQYFPQKEEVESILKHIGVSIEGEPTDQQQVGKKVPERLKTKKIRGGVCLVIAEGLIGKSHKVAARINVWEDEYFKEQARILKGLKKEKGSEKSTEVLPPYMREMVAGRMVLGFPGKRGGFRLKYGRTRLSGFASSAISPATMELFGEYITYGSQLRMELPFKSTIITASEDLEGPFVRLKSGKVYRINTQEEMKKVKEQIEYIYDLGQILIAPGEFVQAGVAAKQGYTAELWEAEYRQKKKESAKNEKSKRTNI